MADETFLEFPQPHVVYAQGTNGWSLNTGAVIDYCVVIEHTELTKKYLPLS